MDRGLDILPQAERLAALAGGAARLPPDFRARVASTLAELCALVRECSRGPCPAASSREPKPGTSRRSRHWGRRPPGLATRPWQVLCALQDGCSEKEAAARLSISVNTVHV